VTELTFEAGPVPGAHQPSQRWQWRRPETKGKDPVTQKNQTRRKERRTGQAARRQRPRRPRHGSIWERSTDKGAFYAVGFSRRFKDFSSAEVRLSHPPSCSPENPLPRKPAND
jgi:hypothetical protein